MRTDDGSAVFSSSEPMLAAASRAMRFDAEEVRRLRKERGLSQRQLGESIGLSCSAISRIEAGSRQPLAVTCALLARALGVPIDRLVHD